VNTWSILKKSVTIFSEKSGKQGLQYMHSGKDISELCKSYVKHPQGFRDAMISSMSTSKHKHLVLYRKYSFRMGYTALSHLK
jgi:hypothetical protein